MSRLTLAFGLALLALEAGVATALLASSDHDSSSGWAIGLAVAAGAAFVVAGLLALARRPDNRTGVYLAAVGYLWFFGALASSDNPWVFSIGFVLGSVAFIPFAALILSHPTGRFDTRFDAVFPWIVGATLLGVSTAVVLFDATPEPSCPSCPRNALLVHDAPGVADVLSTLDTVAGIVLALIGVGLMVRRWRRAAPALRRTLWPVLLAGGLTLAAIVVEGFIAVLASQKAADAASALFFASFAAVPFAFLLGILRTRLARSSVTDMLLALERGAPLRDTMADALGDPTLELVYRRPGTDEWVDVEGNHATEPTRTADRAVTLVERAGLPVAALVHDPALDEARELVDTLTAAAGLAIQNGRLHAELRAEARLVQALTDTMPSLLANVDLDARIVKINLATLDASGYSDPADVRGQYFWDVFLDPDEREAMQQRFASAAPDHPPAEHVNRFTNVRGEEHVIYWRSAPVRDEDGNVVSIVSGGLDITERERMAEEKERERAFLNAIANNAPSLLCLIDDEGRLTDGGANRTFERTLGWGPEDIGGQVFWERFVHPDDAGEVRELIERVVAGESLGDHDHHWLTASGQRVLIAWTCVPLPKLDERTLFLVRGVDVTERKEREEEVERQRAFLHAISEAVPSFLVAVDPDAVVVEQNNNRAFLERFGWSREEIVGKSFLTLIGRDDDTETRTAIAHAAAGEPQTDLESAWIDRSGEERLVSWSARPVLDPAGKRLVVINGVDVTVRRRLDEEIRASRARLLRAEDAARRRLERNLHDGAQQRLVAISVALRLAESKLAEQPEEAAALVHGSREELALALDELRELARGIHPAILTDRGLRPALEALVGRAAIPVDLESPDERVAPAVEAAAYYVVAEALTNVAKYGSASAAAVSVARSDGRLTVTVSDDGVGGADPARGTGLRGLADRVAALEGSLSVESPPGAGTLIRAEIPLAAVSDE